MYYVTLKKKLHKEFAIRKKNLLEIFQILF